MKTVTHQYVQRETGEILTEPLYYDRLIRLMYTRVREHAPSVFRSLVARRTTHLLGRINYDLPLTGKLTGIERFLERMGVDLGECLDPPAALNTPRKVFERKLRYWECRPMPVDPGTVVSPADARVLVGSFREQSQLFIKEKFFHFEELLGPQDRWRTAFQGGDFAIFRLTPEKYHYNHVPVSGRVVDIYSLDGDYHSCNPDAVVAVATPYSKNKRVVTVIDTDVDEGTGIGLVAMIEVVALMIGEVVQCYSENRYEDSRDVTPGMFLERGQPKSLYRPGSSTDILVFQPDRVAFCEDLVRNLSAPAESRFTLGFVRPLVETDVKVRSAIAVNKRKELS